jgi:uncharacterized protein (TIGR04255 family)
MAINEVFSNPIVKQVIFQITFPNLFFLEDKIGDFQLSIMNQFPNSELINRTEFFYADVGPEIDENRVEKNIKKRTGAKIWKFTNADNVIVNVTTNSLDISSTSHKTYNNEGSDYKFRDTITFVVEAFLAITKIPIILRMGLRYTDEISIDEVNKDIYLSYLNTAFNTDKFDPQNAKNIQYAITTTIEDIGLNYKEILNSKEKKILLDFDGFLVNIPAVDFIQRADQIHTLLSNEFERTIKEPVYEIMRKPL